MHDTGERYVCAFAGRRDSYQVALALNENGMLEALVTDFYSGACTLSIARLLPARIADAIAGRHVPGMDESRVRSLVGTFMWQQLRHRLGFSRAVTHLWGDKRLSLAAAAAARRSRAHLLLYHSYA